MKTSLFTREGKEEYTLHTHTHTHAHTELKKFMARSSKRAPSSVTGALAKQGEYRLWLYYNVIII